MSVTAVRKYLPFVYFEIYKSCFEGIEMQLTFQVEMYSWYEWCQTFSFKFCAICTSELRG